MAEFVVGGFVPFGIGFYAHQAAHIVFQIHVPGRSMVIFFVFGIWLARGINLDLVVKGFGQCRETQALVKAFGLFAPAIRRLSVFSWASKLIPFTSTMLLQSWPQRLGNQCAGNLIRHLLYAVFFSQFVTGIGMQFPVKRQ